MRNQPQPRDYDVQAIDGWWYVVDVHTARRSRQFRTEAEARIALSGILVRNLVNE